LKSIVAIVKGSYQTVYRDISGAMQLAGAPQIASGSRVAIKINICEARTPETGAITHPLFLDAVLHYLREHYQDLKIYVVESDATVVLADDYIKWFGFLPVLQKWQAQWSNLSKQNVIPHKINGRVLKEVPVAEVLEGSHIISLAKLKTNTMTGVTFTLKNQFGCLPLVDKSIYHDRIDDVIADVNTVLRPHYSFVDGIIGMGGTQGPGIGVPVPANVVICGQDPVAVDTACARIMGFNPWFVGHIRKSARAGVGSLKYELKGLTLKEARVNFEVNKLEMWLLKFGGSLQRRAQKRLRDAWKS